MTLSNHFAALPAPACAKVDHAETRHGITRRDEYHWLRAENWREVFRDESLLPAPIRAQLEAENAYQEALLAGTEDLRATLVAEMRGRMKEDDSSVPLPHGPWAYGTSFVAGGQHRRFVRRPVGGGPDAVLLDGDREAEGKAYFRIGGVEHSPDHGFLVWGSDDTGSEFYTLRARDLSTGADLPDRVERTGGHGVWDADRTGFYYVLRDENHRPVQVLHHVLGTPPTEDRVIHEEEDPGFFISIFSTRDHQWLAIGLGDHETTEVRLLPLGDPGAEPRVMERRRDGVHYEIEEGGDVWFVLTNADGAKDFKIMTAPTQAPGRDNWVELVPHVPGRLILSILSFKDFLVRLERENGLPRIVVRDRASGEEHAIAFDEEVYALGLHGSYEYDTEVVRFTYSSMTQPDQEYDYHMRRRERVLLKTQEVPSGHDPSDYVSRRLMAPSHDGELVPVSILYRKDTPLDGSAPCLLYGY
ncbi:MAG TPA: S9 family peptidase, partial [Rubellimicrobium sp.]|nr:S9 family peptidase [Rubellimicrobium sp.]